MKIDLKEQRTVTICSSVSPAKYVRYFIGSATTPSKIVKNKSFVDCESVHLLRNPRGGAISSTAFSFIKTSFYSRTLSRTGYLGMNKQIFSHGTLSTFGASTPPYTISDKKPPLHFRPIKNCYIRDELLGRFPVHLSTRTRSTKK